MGKITWQRRLALCTLKVSESDARIVFSLSLKRGRTLEITSPFRIFYARNLKKFFSLVDN